MWAKSSGSALAMVGIIVAAYTVFTYTTTKLWIVWSLKKENI
jgi:hypothetical protein